MPRPAPLVLGFLCLLGSSAASQPAPQALLSAWAEDQQDAFRGVESVTLAEQVAHAVEGPRGATEVVFRGTIRYARGAQPERDVESVAVDGRTEDRERGGRARRRLGRAFGPAGRELAAPPPLPLPALASAEAAGTATADRVDGEDAWRLALGGRRGRRAEVWFSRSRTAPPRLLRTRTETRHRGARVVRETDYARSGSLDLPREVRTEATVRQRRRLRDYVVTVRSVGRYRPAPPER